MAGLKTRDELGKCSMTFLRALCVLCGGRFLRGIDETH
jgi:hypothetical protein